MKKWTVMLIPHDRGRTVTLNVSRVYLWLAVAVAVGLTFASTFYCRRSQALAERTANLVQTRQGVQHPPPAMRERTPVSAAERTRIERELRAEYEARDAALAAQLDELYELEVEVRQITGLPPKDSQTLGAIGDGADGKGGPPSALDESPEIPEDEMLRPAHLIYGVSRPSADLIVQEISLRTASLEALLEDMEDQRERIEHTPSIWPTAQTSRRISSRFGLRRDPFSGRIRHHDGVDIVAPYRSPVLATADGVIVYSGYKTYMGHTVEIDHGYGIHTVYGHLQKRLVEVGDRVSRGQLIGQLGNTGRRSTGAHIHYEVQVDGKPVDPRRYFGS